MSSLIVLGYRRGLAAAVQRRGLDAVHVVDKEKSALDGTTWRKVNDLEDAQEVLRTVATLDTSDVVGVVTGHEHPVFTAALLRDHLDLPGYRDWAHTLVFRDKFLQKAALPPDVPRARCVHVTAATPYAELAEQLGSPFVVKPANGYGSFRTTVVAGPEEYEGLLGAVEGPAFGSLDAGRSDVAFVAESFVTGSEIHVDGFWLGGELAWFSVCRYHQPLRSWLAGSVVASHVASPEDTALHASVRDLTERSMRGLAAPDCVFHFEAFDDDGALSFGECAMRLGGAHVPEIVEPTYGVNLYDAEVDLALGRHPTIAPRVPELLHGYVYPRRYAERPLTQADFEREFTFVELDYPDEDRASGVYGRNGLAILADPDEQTLVKRIGEVIAFNEPQP